MASIHPWHRALLGALVAIYARIICVQAEQCPWCAPRERPPLDIVVPFYERDLCKLRTAVKSWVQHDPDHIFGDIYLMWISESGRLDDYDRELEDIQRIIEGSNRTLHLFDFADRMQKAKLSGWYAQQVAKLKIASVVRSDFYIVMDSKNALVTDVNASTFWTSCNQAKVFADFAWGTGQSNGPLPEPHAAWYRAAASKFNVWPPWDSRWPASVTPLSVHRKTMLDMLQALGESPNLEQFCNGTLCDALAWGGQQTTEFALYMVYARMRSQTDCIHNVVSGPSIWGSTSGGVWTLWAWGPSMSHWAVETAANAISEHAAKATFFGFQHAALDAVSAQNRSAVALKVASVYDKAGLYDFGSLNEFAMCLAGTKLQLRPDEPLVEMADPCGPSWLCAPRATPSPANSSSSPANSSFSRSWSLPTLRGGRRPGVQTDATTGEVIILSTGGQEKADAVPWWLPHTRDGAALGVILTSLLALLAAATRNLRRSGNRDMVRMAALPQDSCEDLVHE